MVLVSDGTRFTFTKALDLASILDIQHKEGHVAYQENIFHKWEMHAMLYIVPGLVSCIPNLGILQKLSNLGQDPSAPIIDTALASEIVMIL